MFSLIIQSTLQLALTVHDYFKIKILLLKYDMRTYRVCLNYHNKVVLKIPTLTDKTRDDNYIRKLDGYWST